MCQIRVPQIKRCFSVFFYYVLSSTRLPINRQDGRRCKYTTFFLFGKIICRKMPSLIVIRLVVEDGEGAVELFHEEEPDHLVVEGHL